MSKKNENAWWKKPRVTKREDILNLHESANYLGISYPKFKQVLDTGAIPYRKVGRIYLLLKKHLDDWVEGSDGKKPTNNENAA